MDLRYNKETDSFERVESFSVDAIDSQIALCQSQINGFKVQMDACTKQIADLQKLKDDRDNYLNGH